VNRIGVLLGIKPSGFSYKYDGQSTGLDTLININGYYRSEYPMVSRFNYEFENDYSFIFFNNGLVCCTWMDPIMIFTNYNNKYNNKPLWGSYRLFNDTIRIQLLGDADPAQKYISTSYYEFIIKNKTTIEFTENNSSKINYNDNEKWGYELNEKNRVFNFHPLETRIDSTTWLFKKKWFYKKE